MARSQRWCIGFVVAGTACGELVTLPDAGAPPVTITVVDDDGAPVSGLTVLFQQADSALIAKPTTDADGVATASLEAGFVSVVLDVPVAGRTPPELITIAGVEAGDVLRIGPDLAAPAAAATMTLTYPAFEDARRYELDADCPGTSAPVARGDAKGTSMTLSFPACTSVDVGLRAYGTDDALLAAAGVVGVPVADGTATELTATWSPAATIALSIADLPAGASPFLVGLDALGSNERVIPARQPIAAIFGQIPGDVTVPAALGATVRTTTIVNLADDGARARVVERVALGAMLPIALGPLPPELGAAYGFDAAGPAFTWTESTLGPTPDGVMVRGDFARPGVATWRWTLIAPYQAGRATLPLLPPPYDGFNVRAGDLDANDDPALTRLTSLWAIDGGYAALRQGAGTETPGAPAGWPVAAGQRVASTYRAH